LLVCRWAGFRANGPAIGGRYNRLEFLGQLVAYTRALAQDEAEGWFLDE
jgi:hypothetical protein